MQSLMRLVWQSAAVTAFLHLGSVPGWSSVLYSNGAINGTIDGSPNLIYDALPIYTDANLMTYAITDSFVISATSTVTAISNIGLWSQSYPETLSWIISTSPGGSGTVEGAGKVGAGTNAILSISGFASTPSGPGTSSFNIFSASFSVGSLALSPGTYYLQLFSATALATGISNTYFVGWDINNGPSTAYGCGDSPIVPGPAGAESACNGSIGSESFQIIGNVSAPPAPEPASAVLFGIGLMALARIARLRKA
jgi:hypothetical protein